MSTHSGAWKKLAVRSWQWFGSMRRAWLSMGSHLAPPRISKSFHHSPKIIFQFPAQSLQKHLELQKHERTQWSSHTVLAPTLTCEELILDRGFVVLVKQLSSGGWAG
eukprot:6342093-Amphidinium_carterae.1